MTSERFGASVTSAGMVGEQGVAAPCFSYAFYASCIHVVHTRNLLYMNALFIHTCSAEEALLLPETFFNMHACQHGPAPRHLTIPSSRFAPQNI